MIKIGIFNGIKKYLTDLGLDMSTTDIRYAYVVYYFYIENPSGYNSVRKTIQRAIEDNEMEVSFTTFLRSYERTKDKLIKLGHSGNIHTIVSGIVL